MRMMIQREVGVLGLALALAFSTAFAAQADPEEDYQRGLEAYQQEDVIVAMQLLVKPAEAGYSPAQVLLAYIMDKAEENEQAFELYRKAAEQGDPAGQLGFGGMYASGEGVEQSSEQAVLWITRAAEQGFGSATVVLAEAYLGGDLGLETSEEEAIRWLQRGADAGHEPAQVKLDELRAKSAQPESADE